MTCAVVLRSPQGLTLPQNLPLGPGCDHLLESDNDLIFKRLVHSAGEHGLAVSRDIKKYRGLGPGRLFEIAKVAARQNGAGTSKYIRQYEGLSPQQLFEVAQLAAVSDGYWTSHFIEEYVGLSPDQLFEIAKLAATKVGEQISEYIQNFKGLSNEQMFTVAKLAAARGGVPSVHIKNYGDLSPEQLFEVAMISAARAGGNISSNIDQYDRLSPDQLFEVAKLAAAQNPEVTSVRIRDYRGLSTDQLFEVAKTAAARSGGLTSSHIRLYRGLNTDQLFQVAKIAAAQDGFATSIHINEYEGLNPSQLFEIAKIVADQSGYVPYLANFGLTEWQIRRVARISLRKSEWRMVLVFTSSEKVASDLQRIKPLGRIDGLDELESIESLKSHLQNSLFRSMIGAPWNYSKTRKTDEVAELEKLLSLAWDRVQRREVGLGLIEMGLKRLAYGRTLPSTSTELLSLTSGFDLSRLPKKVSSDSISDIYGLLLDIQKNLHAPFFKNIEWPNEFNTPAQVIQILTLIRDLKSIKGDSQVSANYVWNLLRKPSGFRAEVLQDEIVKYFIELFETEKSERAHNTQSEILNFNFQSLDQLQKLWGTFEPVMTLASRYQSVKGKEELLAGLKKTFSASLDGRFKELKFRGLGKEDQLAAQRQLSMLTSAQIEAWAKSRVLVEPFNKSGPETNDLRIQIENLIQTNLVPHTNALKLKYSSTMNVVSPHELVDFVLHWKSTPEELMAELKSKFGNLPSQVIFLSLLRPFEKNLSLTSEDELLRLIAVLEHILRTTYDLVDLQDREDLSRDLQGLRSLLKSEVQGSASNKFLVMTVLNSDPKFLLTIGDVVKTSSCQNYRTGGKIETLLGYVLDAHIQALVSFALEPRHFASALDFNLVYEAFSNNATPSVEFDGNRRVATFKLKSGGTIVSMPLPQGYLRRMLKLGKTVENRPALFLEREYVQNHRALAQMQAQIQLVTETLGQELGADPDPGQIEISGSRSALGHYSDAAGGEQISNYNVKKP